MGTRPYHFKNSVNGPHWEIMRLRGKRAEPDFQLMLPSLRCLSVAASHIRESENFVYTLSFLFIRRC